MLPSYTLKLIEQYVLRIQIFGLYPYHVSYGILSYVFVSYIDIKHRLIRPIQT